MKLFVTAFLVGSCIMQQLRRSQATSPQHRERMIKQNSFPAVYRSAHFNLSLERTSGGLNSHLLLNAGTAVSLDEGWAWNPSNVGISQPLWTICSIACLTELMEVSSLHPVWTSCSNSCSLSLHPLIFHCWDSIISMTSSGNWKAVIKSPFLPKLSLVWG